MPELNDALAAIDALKPGEKLIYILSHGWVRCCKYEKL
jgi:hypothetical protein